MYQKLYDPFWSLLYSVLMTICRFCFWKFDEIETIQLNIVFQKQKSVRFNQILAEVWLNRGIGVLIKSPTVSSTRATEHSSISFKNWIEYATIHLCLKTRAELRLSQIRGHELKRVEKNRKTFWYIEEIFYCVCTEHFNP